MRAQTAIDIAGNAGHLIGASTLGAIGGGVGAIGGGVSAVCNGGSIQEGVQGGAALGAHYGSKVGGPIFEYTSKGVAYAAQGTFYSLMWAMPYFCSSAKWVASNSYNTLRNSAFYIHDYLSGLNSNANDETSDLEQYNTKINSNKREEDVYDDLGYVIKECELDFLEIIPFIEMKNNDKTNNKCPLGLNISNITKTLSGS
ncbi:hypothetical protein [Cardinium endosymbiont of Nabis limbatus]|uniref:hypothetical protein n=1 Tax=Cardinium endosymbiont of Nabis limbatus TaxID=3066217 RepID=UPI003AF3C177